MRIVFVFKGKDPQVSFSGSAYEGSNAEPPTWKGMRVEGILVDCQQEPEFEEGDALYVEGDIDGVRAAFRDAIRQLNELEKITREQVDKKIARTVQCQLCQRYYDSRYREDGHGDGYGNSCYDKEGLDA